MVEKNVTIVEPDVLGTAPKLSCYELTLSTNYRPMTAERAERVMADMRRALSDMFNDDDAVFSFLMLGRTRDDMAIGNIPEAVNRWDAAIKAEIGRTKRGKSAHCHVLFEVYHNAYTRIDRDALQNAADAAMRAVESRFSFPYVSIKVDRRTSFAHYLRKPLPLAEIVREMRELGLDE